MELSCHGNGNPLALRVRMAIQTSATELWIAAPIGLSICTIMFADRKYHDLAIVVVNVENDSPHFPAVRNLRSARAGELAAILRWELIRIFF